MHACTVGWAENQHCPLILCATSVQPWLIELGRLILSPMFSLGIFLWRNFQFGGEIIFKFWIPRTNFFHHKSNCSMVGLGMAYRKESKIYLGRFLSSSSSMSAGCHILWKSQYNPKSQLYKDKNFLYFTSSDMLTSAHLLNPFDLNNFQWLIWSWKLTS